MDRRAWLIVLVAWLGWVFDIMDTALFNFAKVPMLKEMLGETGYRQRGTEIEGQIQMLFLIGWAIGGLIFGILADRWGRGRTLIVTILLYSLLTGLTAFCQTPEQVAVLRFLTALGIGGEWAAGAALVAEAVPNAKRGLAAAILQSAAAFGPWFAAIANLSVAPGDWRALFLIGVLPALIVVLIRFVVKEPEVPKAKAAKLPISELFEDPAIRKRAIVAMALGVVGITGAGILPFWLPNLVEQAASNLGEEAKRNFLSLNTFTLHIGTLLGVLVFPLLAERFGRRPLFAIFFVMAPLCTALALNGGTDFNRLLFLLPLASFFAIGLSSGFVLYFPELFPTRMRATGAGLAYNVGRVFSAPMPWLIGIVIGATGGSAAIGVMIASAIYIVGLFVIPFAPETKGKPLPE